MVSPTSNKPENNTPVPNNDNTGVQFAIDSYVTLVMVVLMVLFRALNVAGKRHPKLRFFFLHQHYGWCDLKTYLSPLLSSFAHDPEDNWEHCFGNLTWLVLLVPAVEAKFGWFIVCCFMLISCYLDWILSTVLLGMCVKNMSPTLGASGWVFMFQILMALNLINNSNVISSSFVLVLLFCVAKEFVAWFIQLVPKRFKKKNKRNQSQAQQQSNNNLHDYPGQAMDNSRHHHQQQQQQYQEEEDDEDNISHRGHIIGAVAGVLCGYLTLKMKEKGVDFPFMP